MPQKLVIEGNLPSRFILLGEDDEDDRDMLKEAFTALESSLVILFVNSGKEVLSALDKLPPESLPCLIVLDYNMPEMNGADILLEINKHEKFNSIPRIVWSTSGAEKYKQICLQRGAADYIIKPSTSEELQQIAKYMLSLCDA